MALVQLQNDPIYRLPYLYISGMNISYASTKIIGVSPGQCRDSNDVMDMPVGYPNLQGVSLPAVLFQGYQPGLLIDITKTGLNGLDVGPPTINNFYGVYVVGDSTGNNPVGGLLSIFAQNQPELPEGYDSYRLIGIVYYDSGSNFSYASYKPQPLKKALTYFNQPAVQVLNHGNSTNYSFINLAVDGATPAVPATAPTGIVYLYIVFYPARTGDYYQLASLANGTSVAQPVTVYAQQGGVVQSQYITAFYDSISGAPLIDYRVSNALSPIDIYAVGWTSQTNTAYPALV